MEAGLRPKHPMAEAINYALGQWQELDVFSTDGAVSIDNNLSTAARGSGEPRRFGHQLLDLPVAIYVRWLASLPAGKQASRRHFCPAVEGA
jgi:hypothetical protein